MKRTQPTLAKEGQEQVLSDKVGLKVMISEKTRRQLRSRAELDGVKTEVTVQAALEAYLKVQPSMEEELTRILRARLPHSLYALVDSARSAARTSWIEVLQGTLADRYQTPAPPPRSLVPRPPPKAKAVGFLDLTVTDQSWEADSDSGIRKAV